MADDQLETTVRLRTNFYRDSFIKALGVIVLFIIINAFLALTVAYLILNRPKPVMFAATSNWRVVPLVSLKQPNIKSEILLQWVSEAIPNIFSYDFSNYAEHLQKIEHYFTALGWQRYTAQLNQQKSLRDAEQNKLFVNTVAGGAPTIDAQGLLDGRYAWWVRVPIVVNYQTFANKEAVPATIKVLVVRVSTLHNVDGIGIQEIKLPSDGIKMRAQ